MAPSPPARFCPAPNPFGMSTCHYPLELGERVCAQHVGTDAARRCAGMAGPPNDRRPCQAWPLMRKKFCPRHDPAMRAIRNSRDPATPAHVALAQHR